MRLNWQLFPFVPLLVCLILITSENVAVARITPPHMEELVDSAELIVIGKVQSDQATPPEMWRLVATTILVIAGVMTSAVLLWRRKFANTAVVVFICLIGIFALDVHYGTYRKVAYLSVSSTIKGTPPHTEIPVYYDNGFVCDITQFAAGKEYLLFLKKLPSGYALSWYDCSEWTLENGLAQTERGTWHDAAPIPLADLIANIEEACGKLKKNSGSDTPREKRPGTF